MRFSLAGLRASRSKLVSRPDERSRAVEYLHRYVRPPAFAHLPRNRQTQCRSGITLVEMLIAVALTLLIMLAVVRVFSMMSQGLRTGRATIEMEGRLRLITHRLQQDLDGRTAQTQPWIDADSAPGYFEYEEGIGIDLDPEFDGILNTVDSSNPPDGITDQDSSLGDYDDILMLTVKTRGDPFVGRIQGRLIPNSSVQGQLDFIPGPQATTIESRVAEVVWWVRDRDNNGFREPGEPLLVHRRALLVRPDIRLDGFALSTQEDVLRFFNLNDISARPFAQNGGNRTMKANSLGDLSLRQNRFAHRSGFWTGETMFPYPIDRTWLRNLIVLQQQRPELIQYQGEDVILSDVLAFDIRAYDPHVPIRQSSQTTASYTLAPGDSGAFPRVGFQIGPEVGRGAFVDLGWFWQAGERMRRSGQRGALDLWSQFYDPNRSGHFAAWTPSSDMRGLQLPTFDTWPVQYERDGIDQDGVLGPDQGTNGIDDVPGNGVDDELERETSPPFPAPLRGIEVTIRIMEIGTRQVRQASVVGDFLPE